MTSTYFAAPVNMPWATVETSQFTIGSSDADRSPSQAPRTYAVSRAVGIGARQQRADSVGAALDLNLPSTRTAETI